MIYRTGDMRQSLGEDLMKRVEQVVNDNQHRPEPYWLLIYNQKAGMIIRTKILIMGRLNFPRNEQGKVIPMLGTICIKVDNKLGRLDIVWALPRDIPETQEIYGDVIEDVAKQAMAFGMPIANA
jgi:hypothetical protein